MILGTATAALLLVAWQGGVPPSGAKPDAAPRANDEGWKDADHVVLIVNEKIVTSWTLVRLVAREERENPRINKNETALRILTDLRNSMISVQAGEDMGIDPSVIEHKSKDILGRELERFGSAQQKSEYLQGRGEVTLNERQDFFKDLIHRRMWEQSVTGEGAPADQKRPSRDRFVSPSYQRFAYINYVQHSEFLPIIGGRGREVVLQQLFVDPQVAGGDEAALQLALQLRQRILEGEDMGDLVDKYSAAKHDHGMTERLNATRLALAYPEMSKFLETAKPGDLSDAMAYKSNDKTFVRLIRLVDRSEAVVPAFDSPEVQKKITERVRQDLDEARLDEAYGVQFRASYVWPAELAQRRPN